METDLLNSLREHYCTKNGLPDFPCWWCRCIDEIERLRSALSNALRAQPNHACSTGFYPCWCEDACRNGSVERPEMVVQEARRG